MRRRWSAGSRCLACSRRSRWKSGSPTPSRSRPIPPFAPPWPGAGSPTCRGSRSIRGRPGTSGSMSMPPGAAWPGGWPTSWTARAAIPTRGRWKTWSPSPTATPARSSRSSTGTRFLCRPKAAATTPPAWANCVSSRRWRSSSRTAPGSPWTTDACGGGRGSCGCRCIPSRAWSCTRSATSTVSAPARSSTGPAWPRWWYPTGRPRSTTGGRTRSTPARAAWARCQLTRTRL